MDCCATLPILLLVANSKGNVQNGGTDSFCSKRFQHAVPAQAAPALVLFLSPMITNTLVQIILDPVDVLAGLGIAVTWRPVTLSVTSGLRQELHVAANQMQHLPPNVAGGNAVYPGLEDSDDEDTASIGSPVEMPIPATWETDLRHEGQEANEPR